MKTPSTRILVVFMGFFFLMVQFLGSEPLGPAEYDDKKSDGSLATHAFILLSWKLYQGDDPDWAMPETDDSGWKQIENIFAHAQPKAQFWLRKTLTIPMDSDESNPLTILIYNLPTAFELYWDGIKIGENGSVGRNLEEEVPGTTLFIRIIGSSLLQRGEHVLAIRGSNFHVKSPGLFREITIGKWNVINNRLQARVYPRLVFSGFFFLATFLAVFFFFRHKRNPSLLFFGFYTVLNFLQTVWILYIDSAPVSTPFFAVMEPLEIISFTLSYLFLTFFVIWHFRLTRPLMLSAVVSILALSPFIIQEQLMSAVNTSSLMFTAVALVISVASTFRGERGAVLMLIASFSLFLRRLILLFPSLALYLQPMMTSIFRSVLLQGISLLFFLAAISLRIRDENRKLHQLELRSRRLEAELLKKSIQPHFIMNTLLSIKSWFRRDPVKGEAMIDTLAEEFQLINQIMTQPLIDISEEIRLCKSHLTLMGLRCDVGFELVSQGDFDHIRVPPLLLHTLIENGLTHSYEAGEEGTFWLHCRKKGTQMELTVANNGSRIQKLDHQSENSIREGMGLHYIKTRLEETWPGNWQLHAGVVDGLWQVHIIIHEGDTA